MAFMAPARAAIVPAAVRASSSTSSPRSIMRALPAITASGVPSSCATPAASLPTVPRRSAWRSCCSDVDSCAAIRSSATASVPSSSRRGSDSRASKSPRAIRSEKSTSALTGRATSTLPTASATAPQRSVISTVAATACRIVSRVKARCASSDFEIFDGAGQGRRQRDRHVGVQPRAGTVGWRHRHRLAVGKRLDDPRWQHERRLRLAGRAHERHPANRNRLLLGVGAIDERQRRLLAAIAPRGRPRRGERATEDEMLDAIVAINCATSRRTVSHE